MRKWVCERFYCHLNKENEKKKTRMKNSQHTKKQNEIEFYSHSDDQKKKNLKCQKIK